MRGLHSRKETWKKHLSKESYGKRPRHVKRDLDTLKRDLEKRKGVRAKRHARTEAHKRLTLTIACSACPHERPRYMKRDLEKRPRYTK